MEKITISVQLEPELHKDFSENAQQIDRSLADYLRLMIKSELKTKSILKKIKQIG